MPRQIIKVKSLLMLAAIALAVNFLFVSTAAFKSPDIIKETETKTLNTGVHIVNEETEVKFIAVGDVMLARYVGQLMKEHGNDYPFKEIGGALREADVAFCNLESPIASSGKPLPGKGICFRARPQAAEALKNAGFDLVSLANNHSMDYGEEALMETFRLLNENNIKWVGAGKNIDEALKPVYITKNEIKMGFIAFTEMYDIIYSYKYPRRFRATNEESGVAPAEEELMVAGVKKAQEKADIVVVSIHWGREYSFHPEANDVRLAHRLVDAGADLVIGHHPHVFQGIEEYKHGLIAYSLGNFVFDQNQYRMTREGLMLEVTITPVGVSNYKVFPVFIDNSQPKIAQGKDGESILTALENLNKEINSSMSR